MTEKRMSDEELAEEARRWDAREITPAGCEDAPDAVPPDRRNGTMTDEQVKCELYAAYCHLRQQLRRQVMTLAAFDRAMACETAPYTDADGMIDGDGLLQAMHAVARRNE